MLDVIRHNSDLLFGASVLALGTWLNVVMA
jgi:hypothetical protein